MIKVKPARKRGYYLEFNGEALSSKIDPIKTAKRILPAKGSRYDCVIAIGFSPVYHLVELSSRARRILVMDPRFKGAQDTWVELVSKMKDISSQERERLLRVCRFFTEPTPGLQSQLRRLNSKHVIMVDLLAQEHREIKKWMQRQLKQAIQGRETETYFHAIWKRNQLENLRLAKLRWVSDFPLPKAKHAVFISSGPSLEKSLTPLKSVPRNKLFILAVAGACRWLKRNGLRPDVVIATDASFYNQYHFHSLIDEKITLLSSLSTHPSIPRKMQAEVYFFVDDPSMVSQTRSEAVMANVLTVEATVSHAAMGFLSFLGFKEACVLGMDFSTYPFKAHVRGNASEEILFSEHHRLRSAETRMHYLYHYFSTRVAWGCGWSDEKLMLYRDLVTMCMGKLDIKEAIKPQGFLQETKRHPSENEDLKKILLDALS